MRPTGNSETSSVNSLRTWCKNHKPRKHYLCHGESLKSSVNNQRAYNEFPQQSNNGPHSDRRTDTHEEAERRILADFYMNAQKKIIISVFGVGDLN